MRMVHPARVQRGLGEAVSEVMAGVHSVICWKHPGINLNYKESADKYGNVIVRVDTCRECTRDARREGAGS